MLGGFGLSIRVTGIQACHLAADSKVRPMNVITGLFAPRIDGYLDENAPAGFLDEWADALQSTAVFSAANNESVTVTVHAKEVSGSLFLAFDYPAELESVTLILDRDESLTVSEGDAKISVQPNEFYIQVYHNGNWIQLSTLLGMPSNETLQGLLTETRVGQIAFRYDPGNYHTSVEIRFSLVLFESFLPPPLSQKNRFFFAPQQNDDEEERNIIFQLIVGPKYAMVYVTSYIWLLTLLNTAQFYVEVNVGIDHVEVYQATQNETNTRPLTYKKPTFVRVFITNPASFDVWVEVKLTVYGMICGSMRCLTTPPFGTLSKTFLAPDGTLDRNNILHSANFRLPDEWTEFGVLFFDVEVDSVTNRDFDSTNNFLSTFNFLTQTHDMFIYYIRVNEGTVAVPLQRTTAYADWLINNMTFIYPMANPIFQELDWSTLGVWTPPAGLSAEDQDEAITDDLDAIIQQLNAQAGPNNLLGDQLHGMRAISFHHGGSSDPWWPKYHYYGNAFASWSGDWALGSSWEMVMAHEICHNIGPEDDFGMHTWDDPNWPHSDNAIHDPGWYPGASELVPSTYPDVMSYDQSGAYPTKWISGYRWEKLLERLDNFVSGQPRPPTRLQSMSSTMRIIQGYLNKDGTAELRPSFEFPIQGPGREVVYTSSAIPSPSAYLCIDYLNGSQRLIPLSANFKTPDGFDTTRSSFTQVIRDDNQISALRIVDLINTTLAQFANTGFTVSGEIVAPSTIPRDTLTSIQWNLQVTNSSNIYAKLEYSPDQQFWYPLGRPTLSNRTDIVFSALPGNQTAAFRLLLSDGVLTRILSGPSFSLSNLPPSVQVSQNSPPTQITSGSMLSLFARGWDPETQLLPNTSLTWTISREGTQILTTTGSYLSIQLLDTGTYQIQVNATDRAGLSTTQSINIEVVSPAYLNETIWNEFLTKFPTPPPPIDPLLILLIASSTLFVIIVIAVVLYLRRKS